MSQLSSSNTIKIGIDFGTTSSAIAWAHTALPDEINVIDRWVAGRKRTSPRVPSEIAYTPTGVKWGFGIPSQEPRLALFKLLLDPTEYSLANAANSPLARTKQLIPRGKKPVDVVADYLSELYKHTIDHLEKTIGKDVVDVSPLDFILTVPAVWSDAAKDLTLQAAQIAGFGRKKSTRLIPEPEAALVCCLKDAEPYFKVGDTFVIADCGTGEVATHGKQDVVSYTITQKSPKLEIVECVKGTRAMCGSTVLNERFEELVRDRIGYRLDKMKHEARVWMMKEFNDSLKPNFTDSEDEDLFTCHIPGIADDIGAGIEDGMFIIKREEMRGIFDPVVEKVVQLVQQQVKEVEKLMANLSPKEERLRLGIPSSSIASRKKRQVKALALVGEFGEHEYLRKRLEGEIRTYDGRKVSILQPPNTWTAVVRGAVMSALECDAVRIPKVTRSYGISWSAPFITGIHPPADAYIDPYDGVLMCRRVLRWYVNKGEYFQENDPIRCTFFATRGSPDDGDIIRIPILASDSPERSETRNSADVYTLCTLEVDLNAIPKESFTRKVGTNGQPYSRLKFDVLMHIQPAALVFEFDIDGTVYSDVRVRYH